MTTFNHATIEQQANIYFEGKVSSRTVILENGERLTLGFMTPGEYTFNTAAKERMEIVGGSLTVQLPDEEDWQTYTAGQSFDVPANSQFHAKTDTYADYTCYYLA
ncbi:pyrimidine/purine nucleoside phosphorylase [Vagococcus lutrae]|uniref:pyrimidine/purine nucleoside phosphorylase n=1 Tax=Vagococcus lutrae TaxID=81947 RepID=UPI00200BD9E3|nr:pyrimidine/purine nucleoside phosphorylase [Vagococcus lutrae]UQF12472.1 pyrimidine/purine nucleoside phosphorylase [Vagococcus lutrae]UQF70575.1 pyrimidine/purine nucleoside phosphorylase [Vagococcus lutrae]WEB80930.1 pyrimidine/purine nucleoside phosphorylase [Vagococcus lutrae]